MSFFGSNAIQVHPHVAGSALACPRAALVVYRRVMGKPYFLLIGTRRDALKLTLPGGKIDRHETAPQAAIRETREEAGVLVDQLTLLSSYLHRKASGRVHRTQTYLARYAGYQPGHEPRRLHWLGIAELSSTRQSIRRPIREQIELALDLLPPYVAAA